PLKGEKIKLKVGGALREQLEVGVNLSGPMDVALRAQTRLAEADESATGKRKATDSGGFYQASSADTGRH
ncbi:hypothetical protein MJN54_30510, partial [Salmonella enterica subsp. enterica serovar Kentucky]|nr:hypothetical protein [Salmonella enterica subsp. enterica serovar Kentucky]